MLAGGNSHLLVAILLDANAPFWEFELRGIFSTFFGLQLAEVKYLLGNFGYILVFNRSSVGKVQFLFLLVVHLSFVLSANLLGELGKYLLSVGYSFKLLRKHFLLFILSALRILHSVVNLEPILDEQFDNFDLVLLKQTQKPCFTLHITL